MGLRAESSGGEDEEATASEAVGVMTNSRLEELIREIDVDAEGEPGLWEFRVADLTVVCITDESADRMRVMSPVAPLTEITEEELAECMMANYDRALDARYCVNDAVVWSAFIHPLGDLSDELFLSGVLQVVNLRLNFGTTYASSGLQFGGDDGGEAEEEAKEQEEEAKPAGEDEKAVPVDPETT
ncbi:MAG: hypothetical protein AAGD22_02075 [Verrucomicrobiota bacterium]